MMVSLFYFKIKICILSFRHNAVIAYLIDITYICTVAAAAKSLQSCPTLRPHRRQPTRLPRPWGSPGRNTGVGCHFLLQCMKVKSESEVAQWCPTLSDPMDCCVPGSSVHGIFQARVLEREANSTFSNYFLAALVSFLLMRFFFLTL